MILKLSNKVVRLERINFILRACLLLADNRYGEKEKEFKYEKLCNVDKTTFYFISSQDWFTKFPKATWPILITEFGERFSYYGIKSEYLPLHCLHPNYFTTQVKRARSVRGWGCGRPHPVRSTRGG